MNAKKNEKKDSTDKDALDIEECSHPENNCESPLPPTATALPDDALIKKTQLQDVNSMESVVPTTLCRYAARQTPGAFHIQPSFNTHSQESVQELPAASSDQTIATLSQNDTLITATLVVEDIEDSNQGQDTLQISRENSVLVLAQPVPKRSPARWWIATIFGLLAIVCLAVGLSATLRNKDGSDDKNIKRIPRNLPFTLMGRNYTHQASHFSVWGSILHAGGIQARNTESCNAEPIMSIECMGNISTLHIDQLRHASCNQTERRRATCVYNYSVPASSQGLVPAVVDPRSAAVIFLCSTTHDDEDGTYGVSTLRSRNCTGDDLIAARQNVTQYATMGTFCIDFNAPKDNPATSSIPESGSLPPTVSLTTPISSTYTPLPVEGQPITTTTPAVSQLTPATTEHSISEAPTLFPVANPSSTPRTSSPSMANPSSFPTLSPVVPPPVPNEKTQPTPRPTRRSQPTPRPTRRPQPTPRPTRRPQPTPRPTRRPRQTIRPTRRPLPPETLHSSTRLPRPAQDDGGGGDGGGGNRPPRGRLLLLEDDRLLQADEEPNELSQPPSLTVEGTAPYGSDDDRTLPFSFTDASPLFVTGNSSCETGVATRMVDSPNSLFESSTVYCHRTFTICNDASCGPSSQQQHILDHEPNTVKLVSTTESTAGASTSCTHPVGRGPFVEWMITGLDKAVKPSEFRSQF